MNKAALVAYLKIEVEELEVWLAQEWIVPVRLGADPYFADPDFGDADVARARLILDLKGGFAASTIRGST